jgi:hypothetical protein
MFFSKYLAAGIAALVAAMPVSGAVPLDTAPAERCGGGSSRVVHDWQRAILRTVYTEHANPVPVGVPYLGFTSLAIVDAVARACERADSSPVAAVAVAGHDVLVEYFPASRDRLDDDLAASLEDVPDGPAKNRGIEDGARAAARMIASREGDGRDDSSIVYDKEPAPGVWQPEEGASMLAPWLGFVDPLVLRHRIRSNGPDELTSGAYARDHHEVRTVGAATGADRTDHQTETARFFTPNNAVMFGDALLRRLDADPLNLPQTARLFAEIHAAMTDAAITCWRLKYDVGFWRPYQAIRAADTDGNPATIVDPTWTPLITNPAYPDYVSGHGCLTAPAIEVIRRTLGEETSLELHSSATGTVRVYPNLTTIEYDTFHARIWSGLHFRDAMTDAYRIGHRAARRVIRTLADEFPVPA